MKSGSKEELKVFGATLQGFAQACINLNIVAGSTASDLLSDIEINSWYPFDRLRKIERIVIEAYDDAKPILERVGMEMMFGWYSTVVPSSSSSPSGWTGCPPLAIIARGE